MKNKVIKWTLIVVFASVIAAVVYYQISLSWVPTLSSYEDQKKYAGSLYSKSNEIGGVASFMPSTPAVMMIKVFFHNPAREKALQAHLFILRKHPQKASEDVDILERTGGLYRELRRFDKALNMHKSQLRVFEAKYFGKDYSEKEGLTLLQTKKEEYKYVVNVHYAIAACYNGMKDYQQSVQEYEKIIRLLGQTEDLDQWTREDIFMQTFLTLGKLHKVVFKDYEKAIQIYRMLEERLPYDYVISQAEVYIGDTYLAMNNIEQAKKIYWETAQKYKSPGSRGDYSLAETRLRDLENGQIVGTDGIVYDIKDGRVTMRLI